MPKNTVCGLVFAARKAGDERFPKRPSPIKKSPAPQIPRPSPVAKPVRPRGVPLIETWADGCRFDLGSSENGERFQFCNARTELGAWCAEHWPRVYAVSNLRASRIRGYST
jgi:hypothetical protein